MGARNWWPPILEIMEDFARSAEFTRIEATVRTENERGVDLYLKNGYKIEGTRVHSAVIDRKYKDEYYISKLLPSLKEEQEGSKIINLRTERLTLDSFRESDADVVSQLAGDKRVFDMTGGIPHPYNIQMATDWIKTHKKQQEQDNNNSSNLFYEQLRLY